MVILARNAASLLSVVGGVGPSEPNELASTDGRTPLRSPSTAPSTPVWSSLWSEGSSAGESPYVSAVSLEIHSCQPSGGAAHVGSGVHPAGGSQPGGGAGHP